MELSLTLNSMKTSVKKSERKEFYWTLKRITATWITSGMTLKRYARESGKGTEV